MNSSNSTPPNSKPRSRLLVDYSKCCADLASSASVLQIRRQEQVQMQYTTLVEEYVSDNESDSEEFAHDAPRRQQLRQKHHQRKQPVTFQMRRSLAQRHSFLNYLKLHYSESDLDLQLAECRDSSVTATSTTATAPPTSTISEDTTEDQPPTPTQLERHPSNKHQRRETLKRALRKTESLRHFNVDTSPISTSTIHEQPLTVSLHSVSSQQRKRIVKTAGCTNNTATATTATTSPANTTKASSRTKKTPKTRRSVKGLPKRSPSHDGTKPRQSLAAYLHKDKTKYKKREGDADTVDAGGPPRLEQHRSTSFRSLKEALLAESLAHYSSKEETTTNEAYGYLPPSLQLGKPVSPIRSAIMSRRDIMMHRQASFIKGSRIRALRTSLTLESQQNPLNLSYTN